MSDQSRKAYKFVASAEMETQPSEDNWSRAQAAIEKLKDSYIHDWAPTSLDELERVLTLAQSKPEMAGEYLGAAYRLSHDMKGQGATFDFVLISEIGAALCGLTFGRQDATSAEIGAMLAHVEAARKVLFGRIEDPEDAAAILIMQDLKSAVQSGLH